jgi:hypothetical protein
MHRRVIAYQCGSLRHDATIDTEPMSMPTTMRATVGDQPLTIRDPGTQVTASYLNKALREHISSKIAPCRDEF